MAADDYLIIRFYPYPDSHDNYVGREGLRTRAVLPRH